MLHQVEVYSGAFVLALIIIYGTKNYLITLIAGFVVFCIFYFRFDFDAKDFHFTVLSVLKALGYAASLFIIPCVAAMLLYTLTRRAGKGTRKDIV